MSGDEGRTRGWAGELSRWGRPITISMAAFMPFAIVLAYLALRPDLPPVARPGPTQPEPGPSARTAPGQPPGHNPADLDRMVGDLRSRLARNPRDIDLWVLLGRTLASAQRWREATDAFTEAVAQRPDDAELHVQLGEAMTLAAQGQVTSAAELEFAHAPDDPRTRYYGAVALAQAGHKDAATAQLRALAADAPPGAPWLGLVQNELHVWQAGAAGVSDSPLRNLQDRVRADPRDAESWLALANAYDAAGDRARALATLSDADRVVSGNLDLLLAYGEHLADGINNDALPPAFVAVMRRVAAIDPDQPDALWYLGLDAASRGDSKGAAQHWTRLLAGLAPGSDERQAVENRLRLLP